MSRLEQTFTRCKSEGRAALIGYLTAGDPNLAESRERIFAACEAGLDVLELGIPFSDPAADGPTIQAAMVRALASGMRVDDVLALCSDLRARFELPIVLFSYANPLLHRGAETMAKAAQQAGADAMLVVDLPPEHGGELRRATKAEGLDWVGLVAPTSTATRRAKVIENSSGFVYAVSLTGVTGTALDPSDPRLLENLKGLRQEAKSLPLAVGFGISKPEHVGALAPFVDGVIVGSELVRSARAGLDSLRTTVATLARATRY